MLTNVRLLLLLSARAVTAGSNCNGLYEVHSSSWSGDRVHELNIRYANQVSNLLQCATKATQQLLGDQLLVFIEGNRTQGPQCIVADLNLCRRLGNKPDQPSCCTRAFTKSLRSCWTSIQRRVDSSITFYRNWTEHAVGFGQGPGGNHWIGLEFMHSLTWLTPRSLRIRLKLWNDTEYWADYSSFAVADEQHKFQLSISGFISAKGNVGDSMAIHNKMNFTTIDVKNDMYGTNCAVTFFGAWWHRACHNANPNGLYLLPPYALNATAHHGRGITWNYPFGQFYSLKEIEMLVL